MTAKSNSNGISVCCRWLQVAAIYAVTATLYLFTAVTGEMDLAFLVSWVSDMAF